MGTTDSVSLKNPKDDSSIDVHSKSCQTIYVTNSLDILKKERNLGSSKKESEKYFHNIENKVNSEKEINNKKRFEHTIIKSHSTENLVKLGKNYNERETEEIDNHSVDENYNYNYNSELNKSDGNINNISDDKSIDEGEGEETTSSGGGSGGGGSKEEEKPNETNNNNTSNNIRGNSNGDNNKTIQNDINQANNINNNNKTIVNDKKEDSKANRNLTDDLQKVFQSVRKMIQEKRDSEYKSKLKNLENDSENPSEYELGIYKNGDIIRRDYIAKLITQGIWTPNLKEKTHNSLIIFDWDDTLLPTTFLTPGGIFNENIELSEKDKAKIKKIESSVLKLLQLSVSRGEVYIITNAGRGWVEFSAEKFFPSIKEVLSKVRIISARDEYEEKYPGESRKWKIQTFCNLQKEMNVRLVTNIICIGDSVFEMEAGRVLATKFNQAYIKTIKFRQNPKPEEINKQLTLVINQFNSIHSAVKNLTVRVEKKKKKDN